MMNNKNSKNNIDSVSRKLLSTANNKEEKHDKSELDALWAEVETKAKGSRPKKSKRKFLIYLTSSAAAILLLIGVYSLNRWMKTDDLYPFEKIAMTMQVELSTDVLLVTHGERTVVESESILQYDEEGNIMLNKEQILDKPTDVLTDEQVYDQLLVPKGKRMQLVLPDGSKVWINSASKLIYPRTFAGNDRQIYVEGEAYLEVTPNKEKPFTVKTKNFEVQVLGTSFNVSAYQNVAIVPSVVLVEGAVSVKIGSGEHMKLNPNQKIELSPDSPIAITNVNARDYISWTDNYLVLRSEPLESVLQKVSHYYGCSYTIDEDSKHLPISGKLDLKNSIGEIMQTLSITAPISYTIDNNQIIVNKK